MTTTMLKAWVIGFVILLCANLAWVISLQTSQFSQILFVLMYIIPGVAAFGSAYIAPRNKILLGASMAIPWAVLSVVLNFVYQWIGQAVDFPGFNGGLILFTITLLYGGVLCLLGAIGGYVLSKYWT